MSTATATAAASPPGPSPLQTLRELREVRRDGLAWVVAGARRWGPTFRLRPPPGLGPREIVFTTSPAGVRDALTRSDVLVKRSPVYNEMAEALGDGLLTSEGERWRAQRRTIQPLFTRRRVDGYAEAFTRAAEHVRAGFADGATVDLGAAMATLSLQSVSVTLFGTDATDDVRPIVETTDFLSEEVVRRGLAPVRLPLAVPTPLHRRLRAAEADLIGRVDAIVDAGRAGAEERDDLVALLLTATDPETGAGLTDTEIREQALVLLLAGYDTTSTTLTFALHLLGSHPEVQQAVRAEVRSVLGDAPAGAEHAPGLALTRRVLDETMRLHPSAYITSRLAVEDVVVDGLRVRAGGVVAASFHGLHRNPDVWPEPERFDPDRFLPERVRARDPYAHLPFGGGPRSCIGNHFALLEATMALATLVRDWQFEAEVPEVPVQLGITQRPTVPVTARVTRA